MSEPEIARKATSTCPLCQQPMVERYRPFCSKRCADIDLNRWLKGVYVVPGVPEADTEDDPS